MSKKPKLLFVGPTPPPYSGPELSMQQFLESAVLNNRFDIHFIKTNFRKDNIKKGKLDAAMALNFFYFFFKLITQLLFNRPDCVYYPVTPTQLGWLGRDCWVILLSKLLRIKVVIHLRGSHFKLNFNTFSSSAKFVIGFALKQVDKAIVQANYLNDQFSPFIPEEKTAVLYQAMDVSEYSLCDLNSVERGKVLVVGHQTKAKGYTDVLKAIPMVVKRHPYVKFYFAGNMRKGERGVFYNQATGEKIDYEDPFDAEAALLESEYSNNYINLGLISGKEKLYHFASADIYLSPSYSEGFSRALLEAMAVGKPLVYTPVGAHKEVLSAANGTSFIPGDILGLGNALCGLLDNESRNEIGYTNRKKVENDFAVERISEEFANILSETIHYENTN